MANNPYSDGKSRTPKHAAKHAAKPGAPSGGSRFRRRPDDTAPRAAHAGSPAPTVAATTPEPADGATIADGAPRPIGVDPSETGAFSTLASGEGAVLHDRGSAAEAASAARANFRRAGGARIHQGKRPQVRSRQASKTRVSRPVAVALGVAAACVVAVVAVFVLNALNTPPTSLPSDDAGTVPRVEQTQDDQGTGIEYGGYTYSARQDADGASYSFVRQQGDGEPQVLFQLQGTPVTVVLYNGAFLIPENMGETWDVVSWVMGDGSVASELTHDDGTPVEGSGTVASAKLDGSSLVLSFDNDVSETVALS